MIPDIKKILYVTDLSENARYALKYASVLANRFGATITILHVLEELSPSSLGLVSEIVGKKRWLELKNRNEKKVMESIRQRIENVCNELSENAPECPFLVHKIIVKTGNPVDQIIYHAEKKDVDVVVMGSRGQGVLAVAMLGSTSHRVLRQCSKPVLVVRLPDV